MMIRAWFGGKTQYTLNGANVALDELLSMYTNALTRYFGLEPQEDVDQLLDKVSDLQLGNGDIKFFEWLQSKGVPSMKSLASKNLMDSESNKAAIEYQIYILSAELHAFEYPEDVRSCLITISNNLPNRVFEAETTAASLEEEWNSAFNSSMTIQELLAEMDSHRKYHYRVEVNRETIYKEAAEMQALFFIC